MKQNLTFWEILPVGLMLFSSFFGAGNLIFPPALGQAAGDHFWSAAIGFCVTGVGMPLLGIIAMALTKNDNPNALADPVHPNFAKIWKNTASHVQEKVADLYHELHNKDAPGLR